MKMQTKIYLEYKAKTTTPNKYGKQNTKRKKEPHQKHKKRQHQILTKNGDSNIKRIPEPKSQLQIASKSQSNVLQNKRMKLTKRQSINRM